MLVFCQSSFPGCKQIFVPEVQTHLTNPAEDRLPPAPAATDADGLRHIPAAHVNVLPVLRGKDCVCTNSLFWKQSEEPRGAVLQPELKQPEELCIPL